VLATPWSLSASAGLPGSLSSEGGGHIRASTGNIERSFAGTFRLSARDRACRIRPRCVARRRPCPRVPASPKMYPSRTQTHLQGFRSPLPDSNRRPPPYHAIQTATGGSQWQRFGARSSHFRPFGEPNVCQRLRPLCSITVPSQSAQNRPFERRLAEGGVTGTRPLGHFASVLGRSSGDSQVAERMRSQRSSRHHGQSNKPGEAATHPTEPYALRLRDLRRLRGSCCTGHLSGRQHPGQRESSSEQSDQHDSSGEQSGPSRDR
jgi:hypothetical protein